MIKLSSRKGNEVRFFRINESSDLHTLDDVYKWFEIANEVKELTFYTYTHRSDLIEQIDQSKIPANFVIQTSNFQVDGFNSFISVESYDDLPKKSFKCGGACEKCNLCKKNHGQPIYIKYH